MTKFAFMVLVVGLLSASHAQDDQYEVTVYNRGSGEPFDVWVQVTLTCCIKKSKLIGFNDHDSVSFSKNKFVHIDVFKQKATSAVSGYDKGPINTEPIQEVDSTHVCYEVTGTFDETTVAKIQCPNR